MGKLEIRAADGGADALSFAGELADAVSIFSGRRVTTDGRVLVLDRL